MNRLDFLQKLLVAIEAIDAADKKHLGTEINRLSRLLMDGGDFNCRRMTSEEKALLQYHILAQPGTKWFQTMQALRACGVNITELMNVPWPKL